MVGAVARDRLGALRLAVGDVELADDLPGGLDGLRAAAGEEHVVEVAGHELREPLGELDGGGMRSAPDGGERELLQLRGGDAGELLAVGVADLGAEEARQPVEVPVALGVEHVRPLATFEHEQRGRAAVAAEVQQEVVARRLLQWRIGQEHHRSILRSRLVCHRPGGGFGAGGCAGVSKAWRSARAPSGAQEPAGTVQLRARPSAPATDSRASTRSVPARRATTSVSPSRPRSMQPSPRTIVQ